MKSLLVLATAIVLFSTIYAAPKEVQGSKQLLLHAAKLQAHKTSKLAVLDFVIDVLSKISKNFESLKNGDGSYKELDIPHLALSFLSTILSAARKDTIDPNDELGQSFYNFFNSMISAFAKDLETQHGKAQFSQMIGKSGQKDVFAKYSGATTIRGA